MIMTSRFTGEGTIEENEFIVVNTRGGVPHEDCVEAFKKLTKVGSCICLTALLLDPIL